MGMSQNLGTIVCGGVSYTQVLSFHMVLSYSRVSTVYKVTEADSVLSGKFKRIEEFKERYHSTQHAQNSLVAFWRISR